MVCDLVAGLLRTWKTSTPPRSAEPETDAEMERRPFCHPENFSSGYITRSQDILFKQGSGESWTHMLEYHQERERPCRTPTLMTDPSSSPEPASHPEPMTRPRPGEQLAR